MNISQHLKKPYWVRRINPLEACAYPCHTDGANYVVPYAKTPSASFVFLTEDDLMNETSPSAHEILSRFQSARPVYAPTGIRNKDGKEKWVIDHYDEVETVSLGLQHAFSLKKASHFAANGFWIANETKERELYDTFLSWKDTVGLHTAYLEAVRSCFLAGDAAIYLYQRGETIDYKVFSPLYGDRLFPGFDGNRKPVLYRRYAIDGKTAVDVFTTEYRETWVQVEDDDKQTWFDRFTGWFNRNGSSVERSEDGFELVYREANQAGENYIQAVYFRVDDIPSGPAENSIRSLERALSYVSEEVKSSAFPQLFIKAQKITTLPPISAHGKVIGVMGDSETVKNADAKFINPADASDIATLNIDKLTENIIRTTMSVFIEPDILKSGSDSSTTIKIMFAPEIQWCQTVWPQFHPAVKDLVEVFKRLVGKAEGRPTEYAGLRLSTGLDVWIPQNDSERIKNELDQVYARVKSRSSAMADIGNQHIDDERKIIDEWEQELEIKARIPAEEKAKISEKYGTADEDADDGAEETDPTDIDNNAPGKTIAKR